MNSFVTLWLLSITILYIAMLTCSMQDLHFTLFDVIKVQACHAVQFTNNTQGFDCFMALSSPGLFIAYTEMDMNTTGMGTVAITVYKRYSVVLSEGVVKLKLNPETKIKPSNSTAVWHNSRVQHKYNNCRIKHTASVHALIYSYLKI